MKLKFMMSPADILVIFASFMFCICKKKKYKDVVAISRLVSEK